MQNEETQKLQPSLKSVKLPSCTELTELLSKAHSNAKPINIPESLKNLFHCIWPEKYSEVTTLKHPSVFTQLPFGKYYNSKF
jgi:hypothetical protein